MRTRILSVIVAALAVVATADQKQTTIALVVQNHCAPNAGIPMVALTDALTARLSGQGFKVVNPYNLIGEDQNRTAAGEKMPPVSAVELAKGVGAQGVVTASVLEFMDSTVGNPPVAHEYSIRLALNLADAQTGAAMCGETIKVKSPKYTIAQDRANRAEYLGDLMYSAADQCADLLKRKAAEWRPEPPKSSAVAVPKEKHGCDEVLELGRKAPSTLLEKIKADKNPPPAEDFTMSDFDTMFESLVKSMLDSLRFKENYEAAQTEKGGLPIVVVGSVTNLSDGAAAQAYGDLLKAIPDTLRIEFFNSNLFDVKNDELSVTFAQRILASDKSPVEDGELMSALKQHGSPAFVIIGDIRLFVDHGKRKTCRVHLALHSLKTGKVVWEGKKTAIK